MSALDNGPSTSPLHPEGSYQGFRDTARSDQYRNDVAQRHQIRSRLSRVAEIQQTFDLDRDSDVTTALTEVPDSPPMASWPGWELL